jgi:hypothetical protein
MKMKLLIRKGANVSLQKQKMVKDFFILSILHDFNDGHLSKIKIKNRAVSHVWVLNTFAVKMHTVLLKRNGPYFGRPLYVAP